MNTALLQFVAAAQVTESHRLAEERRRATQARGRTETKQSSRLRGYFRHERPGHLGKLHRA